MRITVIALFSLILSVSGAAQDYLGWVQFGQEAMQAGDYYGAKVYYENAFHIDSSEQSLQYSYAEALRKSHYYREAERLYMKIYSKGRGRFYPMGSVHIAQLKMYRGDYEGAIRYWKRALRLAEDEERDSDAARIKQRLLSCSFALSNPSYDELIVIKNAGENINSTESDFAAELNGDGTFLYSSMRGKYNERFELKNPEHYYARLYQSELDSYGFSQAKEVDMINLKGYHIANPSFSPDGEYLYFTACTSADSCMIMKISPLDTVPELASEALDGLGNYTQPFIYQKDGDLILLFSSNRPGGHGGMDLWGLNLSTGEDPFNLGSTVNSPGNEICPFYDIDNDQLYYSSDWHAGYGGFDIFSSYGLIGKAMQPPQNLGRPINSNVNDLYYRQRGDYKLLSSNRVGSMTEQSMHCCNDIYLIEDAPADTSIIVYDTLPDKIDNVDQLKGLLPISLYFHNDIPDAGSQSNTTETLYSSTVDEYMELESKYVDRYAAGLSDSLALEAADQMHAFFEEEVQGEYAELEGVSKLILNELELGKRIEIAIKGFASPLAQSDYNRKLTERRIASVLNYLRKVEDGALWPYMRGEDPALSIVPIPYGEEESESYVSDNPRDAQNSIYSIAAARERRVEILRISQVD